MNNVYITAAGSFFPNTPVENDEMENYLGMIGEVPSRLIMTMRKLG